MGGGVSLPVPAPKPGEESYSVLTADRAPHWVYTNDQVRPITFAKKGRGSEEDIPPTTVVEAFKKAVAKSGNKIALRVERGPQIVATLKKGEKPPPAMKEEELTTWTYEQYYEDAKSIAAGLLAVGFQRRDCSCIFGFNCPEWNIAAAAAMFAGGCFTGIYASDTAEQVLWKALVSDSSVGFAEDQAAGKKYLESAEKLPHLKAVVMWNPDCPAGQAPHVREDGSKVLLLRWDELITMGKSQVSELTKVMDSVKPTDVADLIFTSGTTGNPKAVMISHDNISFEATSLLKEMASVISVTGEHRALSYLPLSHIAGSLVDIFTPLFFTSNFDGYFSITCARSYDLKLGTLGDRLVLTKPTIFMGVPRVWEKVQEKLIAVGASVKGTKRKIANAAKAKALQYGVNQQVGGSGQIPFMYSTYSKVVLSAIKKKLGLDKCQLGYSGAAPLKLDTQKFFAALGITICDVYGMSETTGVATLTTAKTHKWGSVGYALGGVQVACFKVDPANHNKKVLCPPCADIYNPSEEEQGEICFRGRNVMLGYLCNPKLGQAHIEEMKKKNAEVFDDEGFLHSGDKGTMSVDRLFRITGRYKELIIGAGGENIAPVPIEEHICKCFNGISNVIMVGDQRKFNVALVTLKAEGATGELPGSDKLDKPALGISPGVTTIPEACKDPVWIKAITDAIVKTNKNGQVCPSNAATIQKFSILPIDFSVQTEELTATLKLKRSVVEKKYAKHLDDMYESEETYVPYK